MTGARRVPFQLLIPLPAGVVQLVLARVVLGTPDWPVVGDFLFSNRPTGAGGVAAAQAVLWLVVVIALLAAVVAGVRALVSGGRRGRGVSWSVAVVLAGMIILGAGATRHEQRMSPSLSGGSLQEARAAIAR